jgi:hypothetical protein
LVITVLPAREWEKAVGRIARMRRLLPLGCGAVLALLGPVSGWAGASGTPPSAGQLLSDALDASGQAQSVHFVDKATAGKVTQELSGSLSAPTAGEYLKGSEPLEVELVNGVVYVSGSMPALESALQFSASQASAAAGKWVVVHQGDTPFQSITQALTVSGEVANFLPSRHTVQMGKRTKVHGVSVYPLYGRPSAPLPKGSSASVALFVPVKAPYLPVGATLVIGSKSTKTRLHEAVAFTDWNKSVNLAQPSSNTIDFRTVTG